MFIYYDNRGVLKEIINDEAIRQGNGQSANEIYFFIEGAVDGNGNPLIVDGVHKALTFDSATRTFFDENADVLDAEGTFSLTPVTLEIPYDKKRELKFFQYFTKYEFFKITVPDDVTDTSQSVGCRIRMVNLDSSINTLGYIVFHVEYTGGKAVVYPDISISVAQWNYLVANMLTRDNVNFETLRDFFTEVLADNTDDELSTISENPVQNKVITSALSNTNSSYILSYSDTVSAMSYSTYSYVDANGDIQDFESYDEISAYLGSLMGTANSDFNSASDSLSYSSSSARYLILETNRTIKKLLVKSSQFSTFFKPGDLILVKDAGIANRWCYGTAMTYYFNKL